MKKPDRMWDWIARRYDKRVRADDVNARAVECLVTYLRPGDLVLDFACGSGVISLGIASDVKHVDAIDTSSGMIELAKKRAHEQAIANVDFTQKTIFDHELGPQPYDVVLAFNILHLLQNARAAVQRASELLKPGGLLVSATPCLGDSGFFLRTLLPLVSKLGLSYLRKFKVADVLGFMRDENLEILESEVLEGAVPSCLAVARKG